MAIFFKKDIKKKSGLSLKPRRYLIRDLIIVIGIVLVWRGIWHIADRFLFPNYPLLSEILGLLIGLFLLYLPDCDLSRLTGDTHHYYHHAADTNENAEQNKEEAQVIAKKID